MANTPGYTDQDSQHLGQWQQMTGNIQFVPPGISRRDFFAVYALQSLTQAYVSSGKPVDQTIFAELATATVALTDQLMSQLGDTTQQGQLIGRNS